MVVCMLGTLSHMLSNKQAAASFSQAAQHLRPGGLLLVELAHPGAAAAPTLRHSSNNLGDAAGHNSACPALSSAAPLSYSG